MSLFGGFPAPLLFLADSSGAPGASSFILLLGLLVLIWYFLIIRPQSRQRHKTQEMLANLKTGDHVVTNGGILGTIVSFGNNTVQLQISSQVKVDVLRTAIAGQQKTEQELSEKSDRKAVSS